MRGEADRLGAGDVELGIVDEQALSGVATATLKEDVEDIDMSYKPLPLENGDKLILCSDGVGGVLNEQELKKCVLCESSEIACKRITQMIQHINRRSQDNYTAIVVFCVN